MYFQFFDLSLIMFPHNFMKGEEEMIFYQGFKQNVFVSVDFANGFISML